MLRVLEGGRRLVCSSCRWAASQRPTRIPCLPRRPCGPRTLGADGDHRVEGLLLLDEPAVGKLGEFLRDVNVDVDDGDIAWLRLGGRLHKQRQVAQIP